MTDDDPDAPETLGDFIERQMRRGPHTFIPSGLTKEERAFYGESLNEAWERLEKEKAERRKKREQELKEHERMVAQLKTQIEREKERIRRDTERLQREAQRKREQELEREKRDPTPQVQPASTIPQIPFDIRDQHIFIPGMTRHGKSTQFFHLILDDINRGHGVALLDPIKGDLITELLPYIPASRLKDCIYLDLANPIPLDVMRPTPNAEELVGDIKALVLKGDTTLKRAEPILTRLIYALLAIPGSKFTDIEDIFTLLKRKQWFLDSLEKTDSRRFEYWSQNWPSGSHFEPLLSRMTDFTENPSLRIILGDPDPILNLRKAMDERKIILVSLPGKSEITQIYGSLLISRFQQAAFSRADTPDRSKRVPFCLYIDEFEAFQTSSFDRILEAAGGLKLYLTIGNQHVFQLTDSILHGILGNVGTYIIFKLGESFEKFETKIHPYKPYRIGLIPKHQAIYKVGDNAPEFHWTKPAPHGKELPPELLAKSNEIRQRLIEQTRKTYAQNGQNRTGDNEPCNIPPIRHDEGNGSTDPKSEDIKPSGAPRPKTL